MDEAAISAYLTGSFGGVDLVVSSGNSFFFYEPGGELPPDHRFPFVTLVTNDECDQASALNRPAVFRLNIGVAPETYRRLFGPPPAFRTDGGVIETGHDFTTLDQLMPHPVYAAMFWVCVLNPSETTFEAVRPLLAEAHELAVRRHDRRSGR